MSSSENRAQVVKYWWEKAEDCISSAKRELDANEFGYAINRIYYSAFYAVSALLLEKGMSFKKHSGVRHTFHLEFIKTGLIDIQWAKFYDQLFEDRQEGDYLALTTFDFDYVNKKLNGCKEFLEILRPFLTSIK